MLKRRISRYLEQWEGGRAFTSHMRMAVRDNLPARPIAHPWLSQLKYVYVEASFLCNLECRMCPRLLEGHSEGLMPLDRFTRLLPLFQHLEAVILTGYGEPLLHPKLDEFVRIIHATGAQPRLSTNGTILNREKAERLLDAGLENLQFSIDAGTKPTYEKIRVGANWERVLRNAENFHKLLDERHSTVGSGWVFVVMRDNWQELPQAVQRAAEAGFPLFVAKFIERNALDYEHDNLMHDDRGNLLVDEAEYKEIIAECERIAARNEMEFRLHPFHYSMAGACLADPMSAMFIDWMGNISPCCHLPVRNEMGHFPEHSYGNLDEQDIFEILLGERALSFWEAWRNKQIPKVCRNCYQIKRLPRNLAGEQVTV